MTRLALVLSLVLVTACDVGDVTMGMGGGGGGGGGGGVDAAANADAVCANAGTPSVPHMHTAGGTPNTGQDCLAAGCHNAGGAGGQWQFAGTIYTTAGGTTPAPGAIVRAVGMDGTLITAVADQAGNFYIGAPALTFPATTDVTSCPTLTRMATTITASGQGGCNSCHSTTPGAQTTPLGLM